MKNLALLALLVAGTAHGASCPILPVGADAFGYNTILFTQQPTANSVSATGTDLTSQWYAGEPGHSASQNMLQRQMLSTVNGTLAIPLGASVISATPRSTAGGTPLLDGLKGFYVEITMHLSSNDADHFYGLYLLPVEHNAAKADHFADDPAGFERWTEIDISESGYGPGSLETEIDWSGIYPQYSKLVKNSAGLDAALDFTKEHRYGVAYDPITNIMQWYLDDVPTFKTRVTTLSRAFHYEIVMDADTKGANKPYVMYIHNVSAYTK